MARPVVIGNGQMLICLDDRLVLRDLYYPHVGQVNHIVGRRNQIGIWVDEQFAWVGDDGWEHTPGYCDGSLVGDSLAVHPRLGLELSVADAVHFRENIYLKHVRLHNREDRVRHVRVFMTFDFDLDETDVGDTALWDPALGVLFHYKRRRCFLTGAKGPEGGIFQFATGRKRFQGAQGTWRDAEDGHLEGNPIAQGSVDSTASLVASLHAGGAVDLYFWIVCAEDFQGARAGHALVAATGPDRLLKQIDAYWRSWLENGRPNLDRLPADLLAAYRRSLLIVRTQVDNQGAILAANDSDILQYNRDHYSYMWPRDGALVAGALDRAGYGNVTRPFYRFCQEALSEEGFFWHKYNPDGSVGSSWHPWVGAKGVQLPIQEDETGLVLWAAANHYRSTRDLEFAQRLYAGLVRPAADFLVRYRDEKTGLPMESYDLWEERRGVFTFTAASVVAGLLGATDLATATGDNQSATVYRAVADVTRRAMIRHLWSEERQCFRRGLYVRGDGELVPDDTLESSVAGIFLLGVLPADDPKVEATMGRLREGLWAKTPVGGLARYYNDYYFRVGEDPDVTPGNPWILCTLWLARWQIARAGSREELAPALELIRWALDRALPSGALPEQVNPFTGAPLSVAPLTWSHATLVDTVLDLADRLGQLG